MLPPFLTNTFQFLSRYAAEPDDSEEWRLKKTIAVFVTTLGMLTYLCFGLLFFAFNERLSCLVAISASVLTAMELVIYRFYRSYPAFWFSTISTFTIAVTLAHLLLGGFVQSGTILVWLLLVPVQTVIAYKPRRSSVSFLIVAAIFIITAYLQPYYLRTTNNLPAAVISSLYVINILGVGFFILVAVFYYVRLNEILGQLVLVEQEKSEVLLLNILPKEIASILKNENRIIADQFDRVSILFADVANFTPMSAHMTPTESVELLNEVFSYFDTLVEKYALEKIKTIGDCYMVAAGVPQFRADHAYALTRLALDIRDYVSQHEFRGKRLAFRIGLNSGQVIAGVIGRKKFIYDLWGDAVNTASRMESHGTEGTVQITEATHQLIKDNFICEPRGAIYVKGKGEMNVWHVLAEKA